MPLGTVSFGTALQKVAGLVAYSRRVPQGWCTELFDCDNNPQEEASPKLRFMRTPLHT